MARRPRADLVSRLFYTNLEDRNRTLAIAIDSRQVKAAWTPGCKADGPRGLALDPHANVLFVACTDHVAMLDPAQEGADHDDQYR